MRNAGARWAGAGWGVAVAAALSLASPFAAEAQRVQARRRVSAGEVTGLEMSVDGSLRAVPGGTVRWFVTLYEVVRGRDLRPAPGATLTVTASFSPAALLTVQTDARGRAQLEIPIPARSIDAIDIRVVAQSPRDVRRVFSVELHPAARYGIELFVDRPVLPPGAQVAVLGRVTAVADGRALAEDEVTVRLRGSGFTGAPVAAVTDANGVFYVDSLTTPERAIEGLRVEAQREGVTERRDLTIASASRPVLWIDAEAPTVVRPGEGFAVSVRVRALDGRPAVGARVRWAERGGAPETRQGTGDRRHRHVVTGPDGRARLWWSARAAAEPSSTLSRELVVSDPRRGAARHTVRVRVSRAPVQFTWAIDGGVLGEGLTGRVFVRVVGPEGRPFQGEVGLEMARLGGGGRAHTDRDGVAVFEGPVGAGDGSSRCGGATAAEAFFVVGQRRSRVCLPIDPDATMRVQDAVFPEAELPGQLRVTLERTARMPAEVSVLTREGDNWVPVAREVLGRDEARTALTIPASARGELWVRARPLLAGGVTASGGSRLLYRGAPGRLIQLRASASGAELGGAQGGRVFVFANRSSGLRDAVHSALGPVGAAEDEGHTSAFVQALLASRTPRDRAASVRTGGGVTAPQPMPSEPVREGLLRDPWRTRSRFIRGRVARVIRAIESYVAASVPGSIENVGVLGPRGWRFNRAILRPAAQRQALGEESLTALGGEPLDLDRLQDLDPRFTYDAVARRLTRQRLFRVLVMLREAVRSLELDRGWARLGDPRDLVVRLLDPPSYVGFTRTPTRSDLFDGWGHPMELRPVRGRARFRFLEPVPGWALVSAGPDGRFGTRDDMIDPFARILPSGGTYAEAVGEDILLARINGVALGRATLASLTEIFEVSEVPNQLPGRERTTATFGSSAAPPDRLAELAPALDPGARVIGGPVSGPEPTPPGWVFEVPLREYRATAVRFGPDGSVATAEARFDAGAPFMARLSLPRVLRPGERFGVPVQWVRLAEGPEPRLTVSAEGSGLEVTARGSRIDLHALSPGVSHVVVLMREGEREVGRFERRVVVVPDGLLRRRMVVQRVRGSSRLSVTIPEGARPWRTLLTVGAARGLAADPAFAASREVSPGIFAWAQIMAGGPVDPALLARATQSPSPLERACAVVAWAADEAHDERVEPAARALAAVPEEDLALRASILAALATSASSQPGGSDLMGRLVDGLREDGWRVLARPEESPALVARVAAALLLVDREDARGLALLDRAAAASREDSGGRAFVAGDPSRAADGWIGTLALAVAAAQAGRSALAAELGAAALSRLYLAPHSGPQGVFWAVAASVFGVFGVADARQIRVQINGEASSRSLESGPLQLPVPSRASVEVTSAEPVWARLEARYLVPIEARSGGVLEALIEGSPGRAGETAGLELVVSNTGDELSGAPVVELTLPGAAVFDDSVRAAIERTAYVSRVTRADGAGVIRVHLTPLPGGARHRVPLPWRWVGAGRTTGLALVVYDASRPEQSFVRVAQTMDIEEAR